MERVEAVMKLASGSQQQRANCYKLLSLCYYQPDKEIGSIINALSNEIRELVPEAVEHLEEVSQEIDEHQDDLNYFLIDYAKLFVGPFNVLASPYSSVYLGHERRVMGDSTLEACKMYQKAGLEISGDLKDVPDHIKVELEFMQYLILKDASPEDDSALAFDLQKEFLLNHLALWLPDFTQTVIKNAQTILYKNLAEVTHIFISRDKEVLSQ